MTASYVSYTTASIYVDGTSAIAPAMPTGIAVGDFVVAFWVCRAYTYSLPTGFTSLGSLSVPNLEAGYKVMTSSDISAPQFLFPRTGGGSNFNEQSFAGILVYRNVTGFAAKFTQGSTNISTPPPVCAGDILIGVHGTAWNNAVHATTGTDLFHYGGSRSGTGTAYTYIAAGHYLPGGTNIAGPTSSLNTSAGSTTPWSAGTIVLNPISSISGWGPVPIF